MAENQREEESISPRGADWEVVSLTASAYAAAPGPKEFNPDEENKEKENDIGRKSSDALFMSDQFVFPPSEHENLPVEPEFRETHNEDGNDNADKKLLAGFDDGLHRPTLLDGESSVSMPGANLIGSKGFEMLNLKQHDMLNDFEFAEADQYSIPYDPNDLSEQNLKSPGKHKKRGEDLFERSSIPCEAWWKRHAISLYKHAKEPNTFWSITVVVTVMGLVILGQRWQRNK